MSDNNNAPAFIRRAKSKTLRARASSPSTSEKPTRTEADEQDQDNSTDSPSTLVTKLKNKHKTRNKPKTPLSFEDDEADSHSSSQKPSRKLKLGGSSKATLTLPSNLDQASITETTTGPVYSKEYLSELRASTQSTPTRPSTTSTTGTYDAEMSLDASELAGAVIVDMSMETDENTEIPSESSIKAAKEKRGRLRAAAETQSANDENDYISLSVARKEDIHQGPHPSSRLMREDDDLGDGEDEFAEFTSAQDRIALGKKSKKKESERRKAEMREMIHDAEEEDEETMEWEREQFRRGGSRLSGVEDKPAVKREYKPAPIPTPTPLPTLDVAIAKLSQSLTDLTLSHSKTTAAMTTLAEEREALEEREKEMRVMVERAEKKRSWFDAFREWVETVATFLDEKFPILEKIEEEHISLLKERYDMIAKKRTQDDEDDLALFLGAPPAPTPAEEDTDELGRVIPQQNPAVARRERRADRAARHLRHVTRRQITPSQKQMEIDDEGFSTDASLPSSDATDYQLALAQISERTRGVLADVRSEEFREPRKGLARWFGEWRDKYTEEYVGAFGGLGLVSTWEFWVRLETVGWDPMENPRSLDSFSWFESLYSYSRPRPSKRSSDEDEDEDEEPPLGPDGDLVSAMLSTVVVPRLCKVIQGGAFDPYSDKHVNRMVDLAEQVEASVGREKYEMLLKSVITTFRTSIESLFTSTSTFLSPNNTRGHVPFSPDSAPARRRFLMRRLKLVRNLLRWRRYTGELFGVGELTLRVVKECMRPVAEAGGGWEVGGGEVVEKVMKMLPEDIKGRVDSAGVL